MTTKERQKGIIHLFPLFVTVILIGVLVLKTSVKTKSGPLFNNPVLGENSGSGSSDDDSSSNSGSSDDDSNDDSNSGSGSSGSDSDEEVRTEVRYPSGVRVKTRQKDGESRIDIYEGGRHLRIRIRNGVTIVTVENEDGEEIQRDELEEGEEVEFVASGEARIRVRGLGSRIILRQGGVSAFTVFPVSVDQETGELTVTTPAGIKTVAVLPEAAVENMLASNVIDRVLLNLNPSDSPVPTGEAGESVQAIEIVENEDGEIVYVIDGALGERLLGLISVLIPKTVIVSADTGDLLEVRQSFFSRFLDILSF